MDKCDFTVFDQAGESAFEYDEGESQIKFRASVLTVVIESVGRVIEELGYDDEEEARHLQEIAINLFVIHEIIHIIQNFGDFSTVQDVKSGLPKFGLPSIDAAADIIACSICAVIDSEVREDDGEDGYLRSFVICLVVAYAVGSRLFDARTLPEKRQRALGLLLSAMLVQSLIEGRLLEEHISPSWKPTSPVLLLNIAESGVFNALVIDEVPSLLFKPGNRADAEILSNLWESVGSYPIQATLAIVGVLLKSVGVIR